MAGDGTPVPPLVDILLARIELISVRMFPLCSAERPMPDCEPDVRDSFYMRARQRGITALEALYDYLAEGDGGNLIYSSTTTTARSTWCTTCCSTRARCSA